MSAAFSIDQQQDSDGRSHIYQDLKGIYEATPLAAAVDPANLPSTADTIPSCSASTSKAWPEILDKSLHFRLLEIAKELSTSGKVVCVLTRASLETCGSYYSLSYTWGDAQLLETVIINGIEVQISKHLETFLKHARNFLYRLQLWIDAICIDQSSIQERNHQVGVMGQIYSRARKVLVWLGHGNDDFAYLLTRLNMLRATDGTLGKIDDLELPSLLKILEEFLQLPYWSRAWIVQELLHARSIQLIYNEDSIAWNDFWKAVDECIRQGRLRGRDFRHDIEFNFGHQHYRQRNIFLTTNRLFTLEEVLVNYGSTKCVDIRDRVFAMLSLVGNSSYFRADYAWSPAQLVLYTYSHFGGKESHLDRLLQILNVSGEHFLDATPQERFLLNIDHSIAFLHESVGLLRSAKNFWTRQLPPEPESIDPYYKTCSNSATSVTKPYIFVFQLHVMTHKLRVVCVREKWNKSEENAFREKFRTLREFIPPYKLLLQEPSGAVIDEINMPSTFDVQAMIISTLGLKGPGFGGRTVALPLDFVIRLSDHISISKHATYILSRILKGVHHYDDPSGPADSEIDQKRGIWTDEEMKDLFKQLKSEDPCLGNGS